MNMRERLPSATNPWSQLRDLVAWLRKNGADDDNGEGVDEQTADSAKAMIDVLERAGGSPPSIWWHGGDAVVFNFGGDGSGNHMLTISGDRFHVHYPRAAKEGK
jgi:hypothetical protein